MKRTLLVLAVLVLAMSGTASAQIYSDGRVYAGEFDRNHLWNPMTGYRPWLDPAVGYSVATPYGYDTAGRRVIVNRSGFRPNRTRWQHRYSHDLNLGGYPSGYPSYTYKYYNP